MFKFKTTRSGTTCGTDACLPMTPKRQRQHEAILQQLERNYNAELWVCPRFECDGRLYFAQSIYHGPQIPRCCRCHASRMVKAEVPNR